MFRQTKRKPDLRSRPTEEQRAELEQLWRDVVTLGMRISGQAQQDEPVSFGAPSELIRYLRRAARR